MSPATTLAGAFQDDPLFSWVQPDPERRRSGLLPVFRAVVRRCAALGGVVDIDEGGGVATWLPAQRAPVGPVDLLRFGMLGAPRWLGPTGAVRLVRHDATADPLIERHAGPGDAYLWALGADPHRRGQGLGRRAVQECVGRAAEAGSSRLLLKTENPANVPLYEHLGFHVVDQHDVAVSGLTVWVFARQTS